MRGRGTWPWWRHNDILDNTAAELANVTAAGLLMVADADSATGGTIGEPNVLGVRTPAVNVKAIDTAVATLAASSDEGIYVLEADAVTVTSVTVSVDRVDFDSGVTNLPQTLEDLVTTGTTAGGAIKLVSVAGTITVNGGTRSAGRV